MEFNIKELHTKKEYRPVAVAVILDKEERYLIVQSSKGTQPWLFPQGGIEEDEDLDSALYREIEEETGIKKGELVIINDNIHQQIVDAPLNRIDKRGFSKGKAYFYILCDYSGDGILTLQEEEVEYRPVAVAVILDKEERYLIVQSSKGNQPWLFPQGGIEEDEDLDSALYREIEEETGIKKGELAIINDNIHQQIVDAPLNRIDKRGFSKGKAYFYILCDYSGDGILTLQEEEVVNYRWVSRDELNQYLSSSRSVKIQMTLLALSKIEKLNK